MGLLLGEETTGSIRWVGELGPMDKVAHRGTSSTAAAASSSSSHSTTRGVPVREVEVPLAVVVVALNDKRVNTCQVVSRGLASLDCLMNPYCCKESTFSFLLLSKIYQKYTFQNRYSPFLQTRVQNAKQQLS